MSTPKDGSLPTHPGGGYKNISKEPLYGFVPRRVTAKQVQGVLVREDSRDATDKKTDKSTGRGRESVQQETVLCSTQ